MGGNPLVFGRNKKAGGCAIPSLGSYCLYASYKKRKCHFDRAGVGGEVERKRNLLHQALQFIPVKAGRRRFLLTSDAQTHPWFVEMTFFSINDKIKKMCTHKPLESVSSKQL